MDLGVHDYGYEVVPGEHLYSSHASEEYGVGVVLSHWAGKQKSCMGFAVRITVSVPSPVTVSQYYTECSSSLWIRLVHTETVISGHCLLWSLTTRVSKVRHGSIRFE